jgi:hypothetical protein
MPTEPNHNGPKKPNTAADLLEEVGRTMNPGGDWRAALATVLNIRPDSVRQLLSGRMEIKPGHLAAGVASRAAVQAAIDKYQAGKKA